MLGVPRTVWHSRYLAPVSPVDTDPAGIFKTFFWSKLHEKQYFLTLYIMWLEH